MNVLITKCQKKLSYHSTFIINCNSKDFGNMTHTHGIGNFSGVLLKTEKKCMTEILQ
jgi:hypothetical protein